MGNINELTECSKVLPMPTTGYRHKDQGKFDKWLESNDWSSRSKKVSAEVENGDEISVAMENIPNGK